MPTNEMTKFESALPSYLKNVEMDATTKALAGGGSGNKRISIRGGVFRMVVDGKEIATNDDRAMNIVIVRAAEKISRQYYKGRYDPAAEAVPPNCWSTNGERPDAGVEKPESATCATCPQNIAGSGQGTSRACRYQQRLAVVLESDLDGDVFQLSLPATSLFGEGKGAKMPLQAYGRYLAGHGIPATAVVTEMRFDTDSEAPKLTFRPIRPLTEEEYLAAKQQGDTAAAVSAVTMQVIKRDKAAPASEAIAPAAAAEEAEEEEEEAPPPPVKRAAKADAAPKTTSRSIADVLSSWDDEDDTETK